MDYLTPLYQAVVEGQVEETAALTQKALDNGHTAEDILNTALVAGMTEVGERFEEGEYYIPNMLISAQAMKNAMDTLKPHMKVKDQQRGPTVAIGTIQGDLHDIGKNLVASMLEGNGFTVHNLGMDVKPADFVAAVREHGAGIIAISALLTTTMINMKEVIAALQAEGLREKVKVIIGGAPITGAFAKEIGADGYSDNANGAVNLVKSLQLT